MRWFRPIFGMAVAVLFAVTGAPIVLADNCNGPLTARVCVKPGNAELHSTPDPQFQPQIPQASPWQIIGGAGSGLWIP